MDINSTQAERVFARRLFEGCVGSLVGARLYQPERLKRRFVPVWLYCMARNWRVLSYPNPAYRPPDLDGKQKGKFVEIIQYGR